MQFKILIKPYRGFFHFLANVVTLNLHLGISGDLKQETQLKCEKGIPLGATVLNSFFHNLRQTPDQST